MLQASRIIANGKIFTQAFFRVCKETIMILDPRVVGNEYKKIAKIFLAVRPKTVVRRKQRRREKTAKMTTAKHFALHANP